MKKNHASWISYALTGAGIGFPVTVLCMTLIGGFNQATRELLVWLAASVLFGLTSGLFFENKNLKLLTATGLHFVCCLAIAAASGWLCGYSESFLSLLGSILPVFLAIYVIVYLCVFFAMKQEAKKINKSLGAE